MDERCLLGGEVEKTLAWAACLFGGLEGWRVSVILALAVE